MKPTIRVKGAWAELVNGPSDCMEECLALLDPSRWFNKAFKERRWDGKVRLYSGNKFPAGLVTRVTEYLNSEGYDVRIVAREEKNPIDTSRFDATYLGGVGANRDSDLWEHQCEAVMAILENTRGHVKVPTGGGKTEIMAAAARYFWEERGWRSIILTSKKGLARQTRERLERYYDGDIPVGQCGDGMKSIGDITCCTANTLIQFKPRRRKNKTLPADPALREMVREFEVLFLDEAHHTSSRSWYDISMESGALRRFGLSGTPIKHEEVADAKMVGATGAQIYVVEADVLIAKGLAAKPKIAMIMSDACSGPELPYDWTIVGLGGTGAKKKKKFKPYKEAYQLGVVENEFHNRGGVVRALDWMVQHRRQTLVLCRQKDHFRRLQSLLQQYGFEHRAVWGDTSTEERDLAKELLQERKIQILLASTIFDEGEDVPGIEAIVLAESVKVSTNALQRIGRGMRAKKEGPNEVWVVDFVPTCHPKLIEHALARAKAYESEGYEVVVVENWPEFDDVDFHDDLHDNLLPFEQWEKAMAE